MKSIILCSLFFSVIASIAQANNHCERYRNNPIFMQAIATQAERMNYSLEELCHLTKLQSIYVENTILVSEDLKDIPHVWLTLHYAEHSCQYFLKTEDFSTTKKNCYNTW